MKRDDIARLRIGVGRPTPPIAKEDWVLGRMEPETAETTKQAALAIKDWVTNGLTTAMNKWNQKK